MKVSVFQNRSKSVRFLLIRPGMGFVIVGGAAESSVNKRKRSRKKTHHKAKKDRHTKRAIKHIGTKVHPLMLLPDHCFIVKHTT